jgi:redox-sensitive bicupin YhaK (pirin superfamily)
MFKIRKHDERGHAFHGWLNSYHTFSFAGYHDPKYMGFSSLKVINDDRVAPGAGFADHDHHDMEILSYVLSGTLEHKDSMGHGSLLRAGEIQVMSAGSGISHSEYNHSDGEPLRFLQIWIKPNQRDLKPEYSQVSIPESEKLGRWRLIADQSGKKGVAVIHQDAKVYTTLLHAGGSVEYKFAPKRRAWLHVAKGEASLNGNTLYEGDGVAIQTESKIKLTSATGAEALLFDLP